MTATSIMQLVKRTLNIACSVRRCRSVNTSRGFFGDDKCSATTTGKSSFRLHPVNGISVCTKINWNYLLWEIINDERENKNSKTINKQTEKNTSLIGRLIWKQTEKKIVKNIAHFEEDVAHLERKQFFQEEQNENNDENKTVYK